jgi:hypothetical protein
MVDDPENPGKKKQSDGHRNFCGLCGTHLWLWDPRWKHLVHPLAVTVDSPLPTPVSIVHMMEGSKASWVDIPDSGAHFDAYPAESIEAWHKRNKVYVP